MDTAGDTEHPPGNLIERIYERNGSFLNSSICEILNALGNQRGLRINSIFLKCFSKMVKYFTVVQYPFLYLSVS